jgi:hypothetical protein
MNDFIKEVMNTPELKNAAMARLFWDITVYCNLTNGYFDN